MSTSDHMTVGDLIDLLSNFDRDAVARLAINPHFPMAHYIRAVIPGTDEKGRPMVFIADGEAQSHLPPEVAQQLIWHQPIEAEVRAPRPAGAGWGSPARRSSPCLPRCRGCYGSSW